MYIGAGRAVTPRSAIPYVTASTTLSSNASRIVISTVGCSWRKWAITLGKTTAAMDGSAAMVIRPRCPAINWANSPNGCRTQPLNNAQLEEAGSGHTGIHALQQKTSESFCVCYRLDAAPGALGFPSALIRRCAVDPCAAPVRSVPNLVKQVTGENSGSWHFSRDCTIEAAERMPFLLTFVCSAFKKLKKAALTSAARCGRGQRG